ncbi:hypothetical protein BDV96DRAFT_571594 [Lophiotrema nucula]|uniref:B3/B4 tRNA-binding domain-containing protein n=1 Tax=Lophiotrema nucula TaxID=690887 RepID=A0A6A5ZD43_9PLEO|nr:hypothetical protein BDV96DRAFT_571594 [Lophiotrema nucula]
MSAAAEAVLNGAKVAAEVFKLRPDYRALLMEAESSAREATSKQPITEMPHDAAWREACKAFGAKPKKERNSLESLMHRAEGGLPRVNRLTDIYNAISVTHQIPLGGEDLDKYSRLPLLIRASGQEKFETTAAGETVTELPAAGEVVWCDDTGVVAVRTSA